MNFVLFLFFDQIFVGILVHFTLKTPEEFGVESELGESELGESAGIKFFFVFLHAHLCIYQHSCLAVIVILMFSYMF